MWPMASTSRKWTSTGSTKRYPSIMLASSGSALLLLRLRQLVLARRGPVREDRVRHPAEPLLRHGQRLPEEAHLAQAPDQGQVDGPRLEIVVALVEQGPGALRLGERRHVVPDRVEAPGALVARLGRARPGQDRPVEDGQRARAVALAEQHSRLEQK